MSITVAKSAGFCFGVDRGVQMVYQLLEQGEKVCTLGPIIHNPQLVAQLADRGVVIVSSPSEVPEGSVLVIRSHGVPESVYREAEDLKVRYVDATCPFVAKIHKIVRDEAQGKEIVLIAGDKNHPEVIGIQGHCKVRSFVFANEEELCALAEDPEIRENAKILVAQTTFHAERWEKSREIAKKLYTNLLIFDTICNATMNRQKEARELASKSDLMIVVGGSESSNTASLAKVCREFCPTYLIETADMLPRDLLDGLQNPIIGLTAGASTPACIIKEVQQTMSEILNEAAETTVTEATAETAAAEEAVAEVVKEEAPAAEEIDFTGMSFEEVLEHSEQSLKRIYTGERVTGYVVGITPAELQIDLGAKQAGFVPLAELSDDPSFKIKEAYHIGDQIDLIAVRVNDVDGIITLSKKRVDAIAGFEKVMNAAETGEILDAVVIEVIKGGVLALCNGVRVFLPASQATERRDEALESLLKQPVRLKILETNRGRKRAVGSIRAVAREERKAKEAALWESLEVGQVYTGTVKSLTSYGAFVDIGGTDGMIHITELSWSRIKHPSEVVKVGDTVEVYIKDLNAEKKKISLGFKKAEDNPWEIFKANYEVGQTVTAKIAGMTAFGAFAEIIPGIDGLIHISQIADRHVAKPQDVLSVGQEVNAKITDVDFDRKRISLSIRALLEPAAPAEAEEAPAAEATEE
ncbi:MAG: bifunctional 4-hydroxy-3-methylbut-2-enyl diphosphate reductase/30S ribosomal protein S1 [Oscillospiraceae bacterium]|nr:bifunctional 4-hydroxy-3-methylbut-2-enyl diphosphate reductase/30S ribosomal protein S1 [Oscillospiraceae bacterium]